jgi:replicative DNA helicase
LANSRPRRGIPAPIPTVEEVGGLVAGDALVLAGSSGMGKTTLACRILADVCIRRKTPTIFFSTEMTKSDVGRLVAAILQGSAVEALPENIPESVLLQLRASPVKIIDAGSVRVEDIETITKSSPGTRVVIVDYLTRLITPRRETRTLEVGEVAQRLKSLAKDCQLTMIELCHLNREGNNNTQPALTALRDSGETEQEADAVIFNWTSEKDLTGRYLRMAMYLAKNRYGRTKQVIVNWDKELKKFEVMSQ